MTSSRSPSSTRSSTTNPPTILLATVDKFARLQFKPEAGRLLGLGTALPATVADHPGRAAPAVGAARHDRGGLRRGASRLLLAVGGSRPEDRRVDGDDPGLRRTGQGPVRASRRAVPAFGPRRRPTFFSRPVDSGEGRLYVGLMPQALSQVSAMVSAASPLLEIPEVLAQDAERRIRLATPTGPP